MTAAISSSSAASVIVKRLHRGLRLLYHDDDDAAADDVSDDHDLASDLLLFVLMISIAATLAECLRLGRSRNVQDSEPISSCDCAHKTNPSCLCEPTPDHRAPGQYRTQTASQ